MSITNQNDNKPYGPSIWQLKNKLLTDENQLNKIIKSSIFLGVGLSLVQGITFAQKKNVLFIAVDDLKPVLGCYGNPLIHTPNIDKLATRGIIFTNSQCQQAVCAPSRASLLTGMRPDVTKVWDLKTWIRDKNPDILTMPQYFIQNGYYCTGVGKIYDRRSVDDKHDAVSWSVPFSFDGDTKYYDPKYGEPALTYYQLPETKKEVERLTPIAISKGLKNFAIKADVMKTIMPSTECADVPDNAYNDGVLALSAIERMEKLAKQDQPFFLAVGFKRPHLPFVAPKKYWDLYQRDKMPLAKYQEASVDGPLIAYHNSGEIRSYTDIPPLASFSDLKDDLLPEEKQKELIHGYYAAVSYIDAMIGKVVNALDSLGLRENTVIVLWGDHGWHLGDHGLWCKHTNFENATRAPLIFSSPEIKVRSNASPVEFVDIFPTLCEMTGIDIPSHLEGKSLLPIMNGNKFKVKEYAVSQFPRDVDKMGYAFRNERYRYVVWMKNNFRSNTPYNENLVVAEELYDYKTDPLETCNVINQKKYVNVRRKLKNWSVNFFIDQEKLHSNGNRLIKD